MPRAGRRHRLVLYTYMLDHWWKPILWTGILLLALAAGLEFFPRLSLQSDLSKISDWSLWLLAGAGAYAIMLSIFLISIRKLAYIQPFGKYLRLVTPFLQMNISYRRIRKTSSVEMLSLFPIARYKGWRRKLMRPWAGQTAIVLEMSGWPLPRWALRLFLSPYFFPDASSRLALLVPKWMDFSMDMESCRSSWLDAQNQPETTPQAALLSSIQNSKR